MKFDHLPLIPLPLELSPASCPAFRWRCTTIYAVEASAGVAKLLHSILSDKFDVECEISLHPPPNSERASDDGTVGASALPPFWPSLSLTLYSTHLPLFLAPTLDLFPSPSLQRSTRSSSTSTTLTRLSPVARTSASPMRWTSTAPTS